MSLSSSKGTTMEAAPGPSGVRAKKLEVDVNQPHHSDEIENAEQALGVIPTAKHPKQAASFTDMECHCKSDDEEDVDDEEDEDEDEEEESDVDDDDDEDSDDLEILDAEEEYDQLFYKEEEEEEEDKSSEATAMGSGRRGQAGGRRKADNAQDLKLEDYLPDHYIDSHEKRDSCSLAVTMTHSARSTDITELSGDIIKLVFKGKKFESYGTSRGSAASRSKAHSKAFVRYTDPETAAANLKIIETAVGNGKVVRVEKCTTRKQTTIGNMLDLFRLPLNCSVARLKQQFPGCRVHVLKHGFARLGFGSTEELKNAIQTPGCYAIDGHPIRLSLVKRLQKKENDSHCSGEGPQHRESHEDGDSATSRGGRAWKRNSWPPAERAYWRGGGRGGSRGVGCTHMGNRSFDWDARGDGTEGEDSRSRIGGSRFFWNSEGGSRRGMGGRRGSWSRP